MANKVKYNPSGSENAIFKGNWAINTSPPNSGGGPSSTTGFYAGADAPSGGYVLYEAGTVRTIANDAELIAYTNSKTGTSITTVAQALDWVRGQNTYMVAERDMENIVTDGLSLHYDCGTVSSYPKGGTILYDLSGNGYNATLYNGPTHSGQGITADGSNDYFSTGSVLNFTTSQPFSIFATFKGISMPTATGVTDNVSVVFGKSLVAGSYGLGWCKNGANNTYQLRMGVRTNGNHFGLIAWPSYTLNTVVNFGFTYDGAGVVLFYRHGVHIGTQTNLSIPSSTFDTGAYNVFRNYAVPIGNGRYANATLYDAMVYNRVLSAAEIEQNYNATKTRFGSV